LPRIRHSPSVRVHWSRSLHLSLWYRGKTSACHAKSMVRTVFFVRPNPCVRLRPITTLRPSTRGSNGTKPTTRSAPTTARQNGCCRGLLPNAARPCRRGPARMQPFTVQMSPDSIAYALSVLGSMFRWLIDQRYVLANPFAALKVRGVRRRGKLDRSRDFTASEWELSHARRRAGVVVWLPRCPRSPTRPSRSATR